MTDTSRHTTPQKDDKRSAILKDLVRSIARASARQIVFSIDQKSADGDDQIAATAQGEHDK
jgi:hypothetical protein